MVIVVVEGSSLVTILAYPIFICNCLKCLFLEQFVFINCSSTK